MRLTFVSPPFAGHFNPLLVLAKAARDAGHEIEFITGPRKHPILDASGIAAPHLNSIGPETLEAIANTKDPVGSNPFKLLAQFRDNLRLLPSIGAELEQRWRQERPDIVIADSVAPIAGLVCERLKIPWITTIATPFSIETRSGTPSYCGGWTPGNKLRDAAGRAAIRTFKQFVAFLFRDEFNALGLSSVYRPDGSEAIYSPRAILGFGLNELEFERDWPAQFEMIGPLIDAPEIAPPLPAHTRQRVLVSHGTHLLWAKRTLVDEVIELSKLLPDVDFVISLGQGPGSNGGASSSEATAHSAVGTGHSPRRASFSLRGASAPLLDENIPASRTTSESPLYPAERVTILPFVSYSFDAFDAVIHHGGAGVTYAAILARLPSLVVPRDYDQFDYAARIVFHKLGLRSPSITDPVSLRHLLNRDAWPELDRFQQYARAYRPAQSFMNTMDRVVEQG